MKRFLMTFLSGGHFQTILEDAGKLAVRLLFGLSLAINHGWPTFRGSFGDASDFPDPLGIGSELSMFLAGGAEFVFVLFVIIGFCTRISLLPILINFGVAFFIFHANDPFGRKEMAYLYLSSMSVIFLLGPGRFSFDYWFFDFKDVVLNKTTD